MKIFLGKIYRNGSVVYKIQFMRKETSQMVGVVIGWWGKVELETIEKDGWELVNKVDGIKWKEGQCMILYTNFGDGEVKRRVLVIVEVQDKDHWWTMYVSGDWRSCEDKN